MLRLALAALLGLSTALVARAATPDPGLLLAIAPRLPAGPPQLWRIDSQGRLQQQSPLPADLTTPLGSLWKLFVYDYLASQQRDENPYHCRGQLREEIYCCQPGQTISRDAALVQSCGLYFDPARLAISPEQWRHYWQQQQAPAWLLALQQLQPATQVSVQSLLELLARLPAQAAARRVLLDRLLLPNPLAAGDSTAPPLAAQLGARLRIKSWSWHAPADPQQRIGGFAGWLQDGTPLWASGAGSSEQVLQRYAAALEKTLPPARAMDNSDCVEVALFARYPVARLNDHQGRSVTAPGPLNGRYVVHFHNGNQLAIDSRNDIYLLLPNLTPAARAASAQPEQALRLIARLSIDDYVARVVDREAAAQPAEAAKALAIVARTYLQQNAARTGNCLQINDSSQQQRVAPRRPSPQAQAIADWSSDLVLAGAAVRYHQTAAAPDQLSWAQARELAGQGWRYEAILANVFMRSNLARWGNPTISCQPLPAAEQWLLQQLPTWRAKLQAEPGYEETRQFSVCRLQAGNPHIDRLRRQIFVRGLHSQQDRLDLSHEYLHLAFDGHPSSQDEHYIESQARRLLLE